MAPERAVPAVLKPGLPAALCLLALLGCPSPRSRPSVLLISVDTLRADHLGCYGYARATSPTLDALAGSGVLFEQAYSPSSWTLPAHASMLSGVSPYRHGGTLETRSIRHDVRLLPEILRANGYRTAGIVNGPFVQGKYGFSRGFERFVEATEKQDESYLPRVLDLLAGLDSRPFFAFVHFMHVHSPYRPPPASRFAVEKGPTPAADGRNVIELDRQVRAGEVRLAEQDLSYLVSLYDGEIRAVDGMVAAILARAREKSGGHLLVVVTSDHGEEFLEHGGLLHGRTLFDEVLHVPLILAGEGVPTGQRIDREASLLDVVPTLLGLLGLPTPQGVEGRALLPGASEPLAAAPSLALHTSAHDGAVDLRGVRAAGRKLIVDHRAGQAALYELGPDPKELEPLPPARSDPLLRLVMRLRTTEGEELAAPGAAEREALRALDYLGH